MPSATAPAPQPANTLIDEWLDACVSRADPKSWTAAAALYEDYRGWHERAARFCANPDLAAPADFEQHLIGLGLGFSVRRVQTEWGSGPHHARCFNVALNAPLRAA